MTVSSGRLAASTGELRRRLPLWGMLVAGILIVSRQPDAITHTQFWAEDGKMYYADVYNHGLLATMLVPQAGYFQELPALAAWLAQLVPLAFAPLVMSVVAIAVRVLPVGLLLSDRAEPIARDVRVRLLLAALYIALPGAAETDGNAVNALWFLAVAALIVLMLRPAVSRAGRIFDIAILVLCATTGVFTIALAPLAFIYRRWRGPDAVSWSKLAILSFGAGIQLLAIFVLEYHLPSGFAATARPSLPLHATVSGAFEILGLRVLVEPMFGSLLALSSTSTVILGGLVAAGALLGFCKAGAELRLAIAFAVALFAMTLIRPYGSWLELAHPETERFLTGARYFIIPQLVFAATVVWAVSRIQGRPLRIALVALLAGVCLVTIVGEWAYSPLGKNQFARQAAQFERTPAGTRMTFELEPKGWAMTLVKH